MIDLALAGVPHHFGFCTSLIVEPRHRPDLEGPAREVDARADGASSCGFQPTPTFSITCAGSRLAKSICQSANVFLNFTVTVWPPLEPVTDAMSRYPAMLVTSVEVPSGFPRCSSQAYLKSSAVIGTPSDHTALGFKV